ncbi:hypothetical protein [Larkinella soli]|uniref:hypothetical protein n=1 Tax=Larkinella soli TaxID=1770527 RepID=UPI000FFC40E8|nr:hypothetical protein [Larkinella soli]
MRLPFHLPNVEKFSDQEQVTLCLANPDLTIEQDENGTLINKMQTWVQNGVRPAGLQTRPF